jgi:hypothetical protein
MPPQALSPRQSIFYNTVVLEAGWQQGLIRSGRFV